MKKSTKTLIIVGVVLLILIGVIGITYSFFSVGGLQDTANTFTSGCLNISLENESTSISLNNAYPVTDIEGLEGTSYDFTIRNNCSTSTNYQINLESLNETASSLGADYIKVALSSDTVDNVISILGDNPSVTPEIEGAYESYNLYTGTIGAGETKTYHLKMWLDYDATKEEAASKTYTSKINVIANPDTNVVDTLEARFSTQYEIVTSTLTNNVTSASYCVTEGNVCEPNTNATITNNSYSIELEAKEYKQMVCTRLNGTSKIICSEPEVITSACLEGATACNTILAGRTPQTRSFPTTRSTTVTGTNNQGDIYQAQDDDGTTYYFAGNPDDNWVSFAGHYWRIIRINGDGTIRLIYSGTGSAQTTGEGTQVTVDGSNEIAFNSTSNASYYVGLKYTANTSASTGQHGTTTESTILQKLNTWYTSNISSTYRDKIDTNAGFCGDREMASGYSWSATPSSTIYYAAYERLIRNTNNVEPTFKCENSSDLYTVSGANQGNRALTNPVGLITADEVSYAGLPTDGSTTDNYLYTNQYYWTLSPYSLYAASSRAYVFRVYSSGRINEYHVDATIGVRPVINLKADVSLSGSGTANDPYQVVMS